MNMPLGYTAEGHPAGDDGQKTVRYLYIVSKGVNAQSPRIFTAMRNDMSSASVELIYDRRSGERRSQPAAVEPDRRSGDRRRMDASKEIASAGWARVQVD